MTKLVDMALNKKINGDVYTPEHNIDIVSIIMVSEHSISGKGLIDVILTRLDRLEDKRFRLQEIRDAWVRTLNVESTYQILCFEAKVSPGTYVRGLANDMGGTAFDIRRIQMNDIIDNADDYMYAAPYVIQTQIV